MVHRGRLTAKLDGDFVVFMIGMRVNRPWKPQQWLPVARAMPRVGLAVAGDHVPVGSTGQSAARRIGAAAVDAPALEPYANP